MTKVAKNTREITYPELTNFFYEIIGPALMAQDDAVQEVELYDAPALAVGDTPFVALVGEDMAFRLDDKAHLEAWKLDDAELWDPTSNPEQPPDTQWVIVRRKFHDHWLHFAEAALVFAQQPA